MPDAAKMHTFVVYVDDLPGVLNRIAADSVPSSR